MLNGVPRILLIRLSAIGDVVRVLPALHALRDRYPGAQIDWAVEAKAESILQGHPALDRRLVFTRPASTRESVTAFRGLVRMVRENRYDIVLDFHGILKSGLLARASGAPQRIGFAPPRAQELSHLAYTQMVPVPDPRLNRIHENLLLCAAVDAPNRSLDVVIDVPDEAIDAVDEFWEEAFDSDKHVAAIHVAMERPEKQWPLEHFARLADLLLADGRFEVLLTYGPGQLETAEQVCELCHREAVVAPEMADLQHYAAAILRSDVYVGGDTGPMHIASAMGVPVVAIFGGTDPVKHAPLRDPAAVLYAGPEPFPSHVPLAEAQRWLRAVSPENVYDACVNLLFSERPSLTLRRWEEEGSTEEW